MKHFLLLVALCFCINTIHAQNLDSLVTAEKKYTKEDTIKLKMQQYISYQYVPKDPDKSILYANKAIALATTLKRTDDIGEGYRVMSHAYYYKRDFLSAIKNMQQAINYYKQENMAYKVAYAQIAIADNYRLLSLFPQAIDNIMQSIKYFEQIKFKYGTASAVCNLGLIYMSSGDYNKALEQFQKERQITETATDNNTKSLLSVNYLNIGDAYMHLHINDSALLYNKKALALMEAENNKRDMVNTLFNLGIISRNEGNNLQALEYFQKARDVSKETGSKSGEAASINNMADSYVSLTDAELKALKITPLQRYQTAMNYYKKSMDLNKEASAFYNFSQVHYSLAEFYSLIPDSLLTQLNLTPETRKDNEIKNIEEGIKIAKQANLLDLEREGYRRLSEAHEKQKDYNNALDAYKNFIVIRDSISNAESEKKITQREMQYEFDKKESELLLQQQLADSKLKQQQLLNKQQQQQLQLANQQKDIQHLAFLKTQAELNNEQLQRRENEKQLTIAKQKQQLQQSKLDLQQSAIKAGTLQRNIFIAGCISLLIITFFIFRNFYNQKKANHKLIVLNKQVSEEKQKSDELLLNILPEETAIELKQNGYSKARRFDHVTVLFTDIVNFTGISEHLSPQELVNELNYCFKAFDEIITQNNLEKIKTIGDAYLAVCGLPVADEAHAVKTVRAAIGIKNFMEDYKARRQQENKLFFELRMGINSGVVVAGIVGIKKYAYDIWGDTVNTAARMEEYSEAGKINISHRTYELVKNHFRCTHRGKIEAKHKGQIDMYYIDE